MSAESVAHDPYRAPEAYYHANSSVAKYDTERLSFYATFEQAPGQASLSRTLTVRRRGSQDSVHISTRKFHIVVEDTLRRLLEVEDTDDNGQITVDDQGPKVIFVGTAASQGWRTKDIRGTYLLSNLLQELTTAQHFGRKVIELDEARLSENPVHRLRRMIRDSFWHNLTRRIDDASIEMVAKDPKDWTSDPRPRIYVPRGAPKQYEYYQKISRTRPEIRLDVQWLREHITPEYICELNSAPGLLAIDMEEYTTKDGQKSLRGKPYVVPGGRFNELYGWDSYMIVLGLLQDDRIDLSKTMVENFCFCIQHYGKILNANRTYYLGRSQPPFLTDMTLRVYQAIKHKSEAQDFLRNGILAAIKEYRTIWTASPRLDQRTGLSRYRPEGSGVPPETEPDHFQRVLMPYAVKHGISYEEFVFKYNTGAIKEPQLDIYFLHDRATRESGHDTSYRMDEVAADLATVDLNSCLYKIECDIASTIRAHFNDRLVLPAQLGGKDISSDIVETSGQWFRLAKKRRHAMNTYMWEEAAGMYFDYNTAKQEQTTFESVTTFWALWAGVATPAQATSMVVKALPKFEMLGGLVSGTEKSRGAVGIDRPVRQWDYPFGWAPHQILAWTGLLRYSYQEEAQRLAYKWLLMITKTFANFNGVIVEKYDVTQYNHPHNVAAEYGNQGADFKGVPREGFGWVNASYIIGLGVVDLHMQRALGVLAEWNDFQRAMQHPST